MPNVTQDLLEELTVAVDGDFTLTLPKEALDQISKLFELSPHMKEQFVAKGLRVPHVETLTHFVGSGGIITLKAQES